MNTLKKISILVFAIALIAGAIYVIAISYQAQESRKKETLTDSIPPSEEPVRPKIEFDTLSIPQEIPDTLQSVKPAPETTKPETLKWQSLPKTEKIPSYGELTPGNPNTTFIQAANRILPTVVTIQSEMTVSSMPQDEDHHFFWDRQGDEDSEFFQQGTGSGIIISPNGYILTNYHVVENASNYRIILYDKREFEGKFVGGDPNTDVALLKINVQNLPAAYIGNSDSLQIGEWVMAVGSPLSFTSTITAGIVSALGRNIRIIDSEYSVENFIQTDAVINPGNSGGALINLNGEVIGVNTAIATRTGMYQGYGFAIPINLASKIVNDILIHGEVRRGLLGVSISPVDSRVAKGVGLSKPVGVLVQGLQADKAAEKAGIRAGDIILSVNGSEIVSVNDLQNKIASKNPGEVVNLTVWRNRKSLTVPVKLGQAPVSTINTEINNTPKKRFKNLGLEIRDLTQVEKNNVNLENGVYVSDVKAGSPSQKGGIFIGFIIYKINDEIVKDKDDFLEKVNGLQKGRVIKMICRSTRFQNPLNDRILFVEID
jgi:serine protease Do